jgi:propanol-preferring alcohol dehydrogenase
MRAMVFTGESPTLELRELPVPDPAPRQALIRIEACGVCRTDLHVVDGDLTEPRLPLVPGHEIVGRIEALGSEATGLNQGQLVGVPWLGHTHAGIAGKAGKTCATSRVSPATR